MLSLKMKVIPLAWVKQIVNASSMLQSPKATDLTLERTQEKDNVSTFNPNKRVGQQKGCNLPNLKVWLKVHVCLIFKYEGISLVGSAA